jgi:hypothetical protein
MAMLQVALDVADLLEVVEHPLLRVRRDADAAVAHLDAPGALAAARACPHRQQHAAARRELDGVVDQVGEHAAQRHRIAPGDGVRRAAHHHPAIAGLARQFVQQRCQRHRHRPQRIDRRLDAADFEQLVGQAFQRLLRPRERRDRVLHGRHVRAVVQLLAQHLGLQADGHDWLTQVVVGGGKKSAAARPVPARRPASRPVPARAACAR